MLASKAHDIYTIFSYIMLLRTCSNNHDDGKFAIEMDVESAVRVSVQRLG